jgi:flavin reductase (DIM6/NTAB) family NADH-FMN oxidoreductase RutF
MTIDTNVLRRAFGQFPTGIAIVTARDDEGGLIGLTMSSFNTVSLDPPLVLFSVKNNAFSLHKMRMADAYAVNVLSDDQSHLSDRFARQGADKWSETDYRPGVTECPLLPGALASFECRPHATHVAGDHTIFIGEIIDYAFRDDAKPLVFFQGGYRRLFDHPPHLKQVG